jgi:hypothetical protein
MQMQALAAPYEVRTKYLPQDVSQVGYLIQDASHLVTKAFIQK